MKHFYVGMRDGLRDDEDDEILHVFEHPTFRVCRENIEAIRRQFAYGFDQLVIVPITPEFFAELRQSHGQICLDETPLTP